MIASPRLRRWVVAALVALFAVGAVWFKVRWEAGADLERAQARDEAGERDIAIALYGRTIRWYTPGSGPVAAAVDRLWEMGTTAQEAGRVEEALLALRELRGALHGIRSLIEPYADRLPEVDARIASLMAVQTGVPRGGDAFREAEARHRELLERDLHPNVWWSLLATGAFVLWSWALLRLATRGFDDRSGRLLPARAAPWAGVVVAAMMAWVLGLSLA